MKAGPIQHCYLCRAPIRKYECGKGEPRPPDDLDPDHVPPKGLFPKPRPSDLLEVPCCISCNNQHSGFDERLRIVAALPFDRNRAGQTILNDSVIGGTIAKQRQMRFVQKLVGSMESTVAQPNQVHAKVDPEEFTGGMIRITKGLLFKLHPRFDYHGSSFLVIDIQPEPFPEQLSTMAFLKKGQYLERGNGVFRCWRHVDEVQGVGTWMLVFYECFGIIVSHTNGPEIDQMRERLHSGRETYDH